MKSFTNNFSSLLAHTWLSFQNSAVCCWPLKICSADLRLNSVFMVFLSSTRSLMMTSLLKRFFPSWKRTLSALWTLCKLSKEATGRSRLWYCRTWVIFESCIWKVFLLKLHRPAFSVFQNIFFCCRLEFPWSSRPILTNVWLKSFSWYVDSLTLWEEYAHFTLS